MGMYDEFQFDAAFGQLPDNLPRNGWQTKDLECTLSLFRVLPDGRVLRKGSSLTNDENAFYFSNILSGNFGLYQSDHELTLVVQHGFVTRLALGYNNTPEIDLNWQLFNIPKD